LELAPELNGQMIDGSRIYREENLCISFIYRSMPV